MSSNWAFCPKELRIAALIALSTLVNAAPSARAYSEEPATVFINELHYDNADTDSGEAIELAGRAGTSLEGFRIVLYNGNGGARYGAEQALSGTIPDQGDGYGTIVISYPTNGLQNGSPDGIALVNAAGEVVQLLSYEGSFVAEGGPADGIMSTDIGVSETGSTPVGQSLALSGSGATYQSFAWSAPSSASFGQPNPGQRFTGAPGDGGAAPDAGVEDAGTALDAAAPDAGAELPCSAADVAIGSVQGRTDVSVARPATVEGVVVGDYEGPAPALRGFYVQDTGDGDPLTSDGIFVFNANAQSVSLGDIVQVRGTVGEFQGQTQLSNVSIERCGGTSTLAPTQVTLPLPTRDYLERFEGMLVSLPQTLSVTELFQLGRFGQLVVSSQGRLDQPTAVVAPGPAAQALAAENALNRLILDDATNDQNPDPILFGRGGQPLTADNTLRGGDTVTGATGVLTYTWAGNAASGNAYRLRVVGDLSDAQGAIVPEFTARNARPTGQADVAGRLEVASFNVLNYFLTLDSGGNRCGAAGVEQECRGAESPLELARQREKLIAALAALGSDVFGLVELENSTGVEPLADLAEGLNELLGAGTYDYIDTGTIGTDAIKVGILYRVDAVEPLGSFAVLDAEVDPRFDTSRNRPALAQTFVESSSGEVFTVVVNHLKSKGCGDASGADADQGDGQGCWNATRTRAAEAEVDWLSARPTGTSDPDFLVLGDLNAYAKEDPVEVFRAAGYVDLTAEFAERPYSYVFDGQWGYLDYALASPSLVAQVEAAEDVHINADEPSVLDYNTNFKSPAQVESLFAPDRYRTSDHDPVVVGLSLARDVEVELEATPRALFPPNHRLVEVTVRATQEGRAVGVEIVFVQSSEADSGLGREDLPGDLAILDAHTVMLRAERFSKAGRTYTIAVRVVGADGQVGRGTLEVVVPHDRRGAASTRP